MKVFLAILFFPGGVLFSSCNLREKSPDSIVNTKQIILDSEKPYLDFKRKEYNFGTIDGNDKNKEFVNFDFEFTNESEKPIIIQKADISCGCISTKISNKPVLKGEKGVIKVSVDTKQLNGYFRKSIYIKSNAENGIALLHIKGSVNK